MKKYLIILSILSMPHMIIQAHQARGYFAVGGEWLIVPVTILSMVLVGQVKLLWKECSK